MININKIYTKDEFNELLESEYGFLISEFLLDENGEKLSYYVPVIADEFGNNKISEAVQNQIEELENAQCEDNELLFGEFTIYKINMIKHILYEARDRVWFNRHGFQKCDDLKIQKENFESSKRIAEKLKISENDVMDDFTNGYWSGIMAVLNYLSSSSYNIDDLREMGNDILSI